MVVDDVDDNVQLLATALERAGYACTVARSGEEALAALDRAVPDLVLLDYMMPHMDGPEVLRRMRAVPRLRDMPVIMLTASTHRDHVNAALTAGATDYITKPFDRRLLLTRIEATIRAAQDRAALGQALQLSGLHRALVRDLEEAAHVQRSRLPDMPLALPHYSLSGALLSGHHVGGDAYEVMSARDGTSVVALIDVCGHGLAAALVAATVTSQLRALCITHALPDALKVLNGQLALDRANKFACIAVAELHPDHALVINAGLPPVALIRDGVCVRRIECGGTPPGLLDGAEYEMERCDLHAGDRLVFASDGLTEPFGGADEIDHYLEGLGLLRTGTAQPWDRLDQDIARMLAATGAETHDDAAILIAERV